MSSRHTHLLSAWLAAVVFLAACSGAAPTPASGLPMTATGIHAAATPTPESAPVNDSFGHTAEGLFARGRADAPVVIYDYSDFL